MWENNFQVNLIDGRKKEYEKQQERLKTVAATTDKVKSVSSDEMIANLLKESSKELCHIPANSKKDDFYSGFPLWLHCDSVMAPAQYNHLWSIVQSDVNLADTQKVSQLLLTSGLHVDILGYIWNLANRMIPGKLTKQEFYFVLALVGLAQTGCTFSSLNDLKILLSPLIPILQIHDPTRQSNHLKTNFNPENCTFPQKTWNSSPQQPIIGHDFLSNQKEKDNHKGYFFSDSKKDINLTYGSQFHHPKERIDGNLISGHNIDKSGWVNCSSVKTNDPHMIDMKKELNKNPKFPCIGSSPTAEAEDEFSEFQYVPVENTNEPTAQKKFNETSTDLVDDFTDFQTANLEYSDPFKTFVAPQKKEIPKIPVPQSFSGKLSNLKSNFLKIPSDSEKKLKVLSKSDSLSSLPESKISSNNEVSTSVSVLGTNQDIGNRLANHSFGAKINRQQHNKLFKIKSTASPLNEPIKDEEIILGVKTTNTQNLMPKCCPKKPINCKTLILKETKIKSDGVSEYIESDDLIEGMLTPSLMVTPENTRQIQIPMLGTFNETVLPTQSKSPNVNIDLISVQEDKYSALRDIDLEINQQTTQKTSVIEEGDDFGDFLSADIPPPASFPFIQSTDSSSVNVLENTECKNEMEDWGDWNCNTSNNSKTLESNQDYEFLLLNDENNPLEDFSNLTLDNIKESMQKVTTDLQPLDSQQEFFNTLDPISILNIPDSQLKSDFDDSELKFKKNENTSFQSHFDELANSDWDCLSFTTKPSGGEILSRHGSLQSLDLKISPTEEAEQEAVWRKCLETCHNLIQDGFEIFNNVKDKSILNEVFSSKKTADYLNCLNIVYHVSKRITQNINDFSSHQENIKKLWSYLEELCFKYDVKLKPDEDYALEGKTQCNICFNYIKNDSIIKGASNYHPSCANLWVNFIDEFLPFSS